DPGCLLFQLVEQRRDLRPIAEVDGWGNKGPWFGNRQFPERQQVHLGNLRFTICDLRVFSTAGTEGEMEAGANQSFVLIPHARKTHHLLMASKIANKPAITRTSPHNEKSPATTMPATRHRAPMTPRAIRP